MNNKEKKGHSKNCSSFCKHAILADETGCQYEHICDCDGYHTFTELYDHRIQLYIALCSHILERGVLPVWKSKVHSDGSKFDGWFILGINTESGKQITYHLPMSEWENTESFEELAKAPEFDGHTSSDVLERLKTL